MEIEYKWNLPDNDLADTLASHHRIAQAVRTVRTIEMRAVYFDTKNRDVYAMRGGLRIREEDGRGVCCLKLSAKSTDACKTRREYEVDAGDIIEGLRRLPSTGAPREICERLEAGNPEPICETSFERRAYELALDDFSAELAVDIGKMSRGGKTAPIHEIELELLEGSQEAFHSYALELQDEFALEVQPLSKLARAMSL